MEIEQKRIMNLKFISGNFSTIFEPDQKLYKVEKINKRILQVTEQIHYLGKELKELNHKKSLLVEKNGRSRHKDFNKRAFEQFRG